jgi:MFS transporter, DHA1 family, tetracycline resistance protein
LMSRRVSPSEQGRLQGANNSIAGLTGVIGPVMFSFVFAAFIGSNSNAVLEGAPFFLAAVLMIMATLLGINVSRRSPPEPPVSPDSQDTASPIPLPDQP